MTIFETVEGPKAREKVTVWIGNNNHGVFRSKFFENEDVKEDTIRTENYIAMLRGKVLPVVSIRQTALIKTIEQLKNNIRREAKKLKIDMVKRAIDNMLPRVQNLLCRKGAWLEKLLKY